MRHLGDGDALSVPRLGLILIRMFSAFVDKSAAMPSLVRVLLFLKPSGLELWKENQQRQREIPLNVQPPIVWGCYTGLYSRYPLQGVDLFHKDWFRFIDKQSDTNSNDLYFDVYVSFSLPDGKGKGTLVIEPQHAGGINFTLKPKNKKLHETPDLRWFRVPLPEGINLIAPSKTYIVVHHPEDFCEKIKIGTDVEFDTKQFAEHAWKTDGEWSPTKRSTQYNNICLTGGQSSWCQELFAYDRKIQGLNLFEPFFVQ